VDPVPDPQLLRKSGSAENRTRTSGSVAMSSDHRTQRLSIGVLNSCLRIDFVHHRKYRVPMGLNHT
jgi:hypothetical protein